MIGRNELTDRALAFHVKHGAISERIGIVETLRRHRECCQIGRELREQRPYRGQ